MSKPRRNITSEDQKQEVLAKIKQYVDKGFVEAERIHELIMEAGPNLHPRLWYGMPGYAKSKDSAVLVFFRKDEFITFGITESVDIKTLADKNGAITPSSWFITELSSNAEKKISDTVAYASK